MTQPIALPLDPFALLDALFTSMDAQSRPIEHMKFRGAILGLGEDDFEPWVSIYGLNPRIVADLDTLEIPAKINGHPVRSISEEAFCGHKIRHLRFAPGADLMYIGGSAFQECGLETIDSLPVEEIEPWAFRDNNLTEVPSWGKTEIIGEFAFAENKLTSLPDDWAGVQRVDQSAFADNELVTVADAPGVDIHTDAFKGNPYDASFSAPEKTEKRGRKRRR